jgi:hypothetical protein
MPEVWLPMAKVAIYVQRRYAKPAYKNESYKARKWFGIELIRQALEKDGVEVDYCSAATVDQYKVILVSITATIDYYSFIAERETWVSGNYTTIVGGAGVLNLHPFAWMAKTIFVFGRAEDFVKELVYAAETGGRFEHPSVCYSEDFDPDSRYDIAQASKPWPETVISSHGREWKEMAIGCKNKCYFCAYTYQRKAILPESGEFGEFNAFEGMREMTMAELLSSPMNDWWASIQIGLDGLSERLRFGVNKRITNEMVYELFKGMMSRESNGRLRLYNIVGYPGETEQDLLEFLEVVERAEHDAKPPSEDKMAYIILHSTPFRAMPCTPAGLWPMPNWNTRHWTSLAAQKLRPDLTGIGKFMLMKTPKISFSCGHSEEGLASTFLEAAILRGQTIEEINNIRAIARTRKFWNSNSKAKEATMRSLFDIEKLCGEQQLETYAVRYLHSYTRHEKLYQDWRKRMNRSRHGRKR